MATFSSAVSSGKRRMFWNVRRTPSPAIRCAGSRSRRRPSNTMLPRSGRSTPEMRLSTVVLPAPFGPIRPCTLPCSTPNDTSSAARTPPNVRVTRSSASNTERSREPEARPHALEQRHEPAGQEEDHEQKDNAAHKLAVGARLNAELGEVTQRFRERGEQRRAEHRAQEQRHAADDGVFEDVDRGGKVEVVRVDDEAQMRLQRTGEAGDRRADDEREQLIEGRVHAARARRGLVLAYRFQRV